MTLECIKLKFKSVINNTWYLCTYSLLYMWHKDIFTIFI